MTRFPDMDRLVDALETLETGGIAESLRDTVAGDGGAALGRLQIHRCVVEDCNRILRRVVYHADSRMDRQASRDMAGVYLRHYGAKLPELGGVRAVEALARIWNGGPRGWQKTATIGYGKRAAREWLRRATA